MVAESHGIEIAHESLLMDASRHARGNGSADGGHLANSGGHAEGAFPEGGFPGNAFPDGGASPGEGFQRGGRELAADTGSYPVDDWYAGARAVRRRTGRSAWSAVGCGGWEQPLVRAYARQADPREAPGSAGERPTASQPPGDHPADGHSADGHPADGHPGGLPPAGYPARSPLAGRLALLAGRLARLRADRWVIAGGSLAAAAAVIVAFVMAGGSAAAPGSGTGHTATTHATQPACVTPAPGH